MSSARRPDELGLAPVAPQRTFEAILAQLERSIADGALAAGDRLPPERELAAAFGVSRTSVREALRVLEALGVVSMRRGSDNGTILLSEPGNGFETILRLLVALRHVGLDELVEFRVMLETAAIRTLAERRDAAVLAELRAHLDAMAAAAADQPERFHAHDADFHVTLARSTGNRLIGLVEGATDGALRQVILDVADVAVDAAARAELVDEHERVLAAVASGDADLAVTLLAAHIRRWGSRVAGAARGR